MAECPFCGELLGPNDFLPGKGAVCPRCGNRVAAPTFARPAAPPTPSPAVTAHPSPAAKRSKPAKARAPVVQAPVEEDDEQSEAPSRTPFLTRLRNLRAGTVAALLVGSVALCLASIPPLSFLTKPLSALGLLLGLGAGVAPALWKRRNPIFPIAVSALSLFLLLFVGSWPQPPEPPPPVVAVPFRLAGMVAHQPIEDGEWVDAGTNAVQMKELRVRVLGVRVGGVELEAKGKKSVTADRYLTIRLVASFEGVVFEHLPYEPWADSAEGPSKNPPTLTDNQEHAYVQKTFAAGRKVAGRGDNKFLTPGRQVNEVLIFPVPSAKVEYLRLSLPAAAFGARGEFRFKISRSMIEGS